MGNNTKARTRIFEMYSGNYRQYLNSIGYKLLAYDNNKLLEFNGNAYACPLCYQVFFEHQVEEVQGINYLTLEHNPPGILGGRVTILTCKNCNSNNGSIDEVVRKLLVTESFLLSKSSSEITSKIKMGEKTIKSVIRKDPHGVYIKPIRGSNPHLYEQIRNHIRLNNPFDINLSCSLL